MWFCAILFRCAPKRLCWNHYARVENALTCFYWHTQHWIPHDKPKNETFCWLEATSTVYRHITSSFSVLFESTKHYVESLPPSPNYLSRCLANTRNRRRPTIKRRYNENSAFLCASWSIFLVSIQWELWFLSKHTNWWICNQKKHPPFIPLHISF